MSTTSLERDFHGDRHRRSSSRRALAIRVSGRITREREVEDVYIQSAGQLVLFPNAKWQAERIVYVEVPAGNVCNREVAVAALRWAARNLGIRRPRMRFFVSLDLATAYEARTTVYSSALPLRGWAYPERAEIWIKACMRGREMVEVVAHEAKHVALGTASDPGHDETTAEHEAEAARYGRRLARAGVARRTGPGERLDRRRRLASRLQGRDSGNGTGYGKPRG